MKKAMLIVNPSSGKEEALDYVKEITDILEAQEYEVKVSQTEKELDATKFCETACEKEFDLVVSMGGDGTLHETINGLVTANHKPALGIIPLGTVNDFARALDIPLKPKEAIRLLETGVRSKVDIGKFNDQYFVNIVAIGTVAEAVYDVSPEQKTKLGSIAYLMEGFKKLISDESYQLTVEYDDQKWEGEAVLVLCALTKSTGGFENLSPDAKVDDGKLHVYIIKKVSLARLGQIVTALLRGNLKEDKDVFYVTAKTLHLSSDEKLVSNIDGEEGEALPATIELWPSHIEVISGQEETS